MFANLQLYYEIIANYSALAIIKSAKTYRKIKENQMLITISFRLNGSRNKIRCQQR